MKFLNNNTRIHLVTISLITPFVLLGIMAMCFLPFCVLIVTRSVPFALAAIFPGTLVHFTISGLGFALALSFAAKQQKRLDGLRQTELSQAKAGEP